MLEIKSVEKFKEALELFCPYPKYFVAADCEPVCEECVMKNAELVCEAIKENNDDQWKMIGADVNWEWNMECAHCNKKIPSAYPEVE